MSLSGTFFVDRIVIAGYYFADRIALFPDTIFSRDHFVDVLLYTSRSNCSNQFIYYFSWSAYIQLKFKHYFLFRYV